MNIDPALRAQPQAADSSLPAAQRLSANGNVSEHGLREASRHQQAGGQITALELDGSGSGLPQLHPGSQNGTMDPVASTAKEPGQPADACVQHRVHMLVSCALLKEKYTWPFAFSACQTYMSPCL